MTSKESATFFAALAKLAVMYRVKMDKATARVYFEALQDIPLELLVLAMQKLLAAGGEFMPVAGRIRDTVDTIQDELDQRDRIAAQHQSGLMLDGAVDTGGPRAAVCKRCDDTGYRRVCPGGCEDFETCPKQSGGYCPEYRAGMNMVPVARCPCAATNPEIMRKRKAEGTQKRQRYGKARRERNFGGRQDD